MRYPIKPSVFKHNPYKEEWFDQDFLYSPDGIQSFPDHHCKKTFEASFPFIRNFRTALDIGCRDGEYTRYLQKYFSHTYAFDARKRKFFPYNVDLKKTTNFTCALGNKKGTLLMSGGTHNQFGAKMDKHRVFTLDSFGFKDVDYIKIDVEGFEKRVLSGGEKTIRANLPLIIIEQNDVCLPDEEPFAAKKWLEELGYKHVATLTPLRTIWSCSQPPSSTSAAPAKSGLRGCRKPTQHQA